MVDMRTNRLHQSYRTSALDQAPLDIKGLEFARWLGIRVPPHANYRMRRNTYTWSDTPRYQDVYQALIPEEWPL
jgi:hypothetical protein